MSNPNQQRAGVSNLNLFDGEVDTSLLRVSNALICTAAVDRDKEIIVPSGVSVEKRYRANPVILWNHGFDDLIPFPIAKSDDESGQLSLRLDATGIRADAYFTNKVKESEQIFALVDAKICRGTSIRVDPDNSKVIQRYVDGEYVTVYPESEMIEWSFVCMGANPETVAKVLDNGSLAGSRIVPSLVKTLGLLLPKRKMFSIPSADEFHDSLAKTGNPNHAPAGPGGGEFTSGSGEGGSGGKEPKKSPKKKVPPAGLEPNRATKSKKPDHNVIRNQHEQAGGQLAHAAKHEFDPNTGKKIANAPTKAPTKAPRTPRNQHEQAGGQLAHAAKHEFDPNTGKKIANAPTKAPRTPRKMPAAQKARLNDALRTMLPGALPPDKSAHPDASHGPRHDIAGYKPAAGHSHVTSTDPVVAHQSAKFSQALREHEQHAPPVQSHTPSTPGHNSAVAHQAAQHAAAAEGNPNPGMSIRDQIDQMNSGYHGYQGRGNKSLLKNTKADAMKIDAKNSVTKGSGKNRTEELDEEETLTKGADMTDEENMDDDVVGSHSADPADPAADQEPDLTDPNEPDEPVDASEVEPPSCQVLGALHDSLQGVIDALNGAAGTYENPDAITFIAETAIPAIQELMASIDAAYAGISGGKSVSPMGDGTTEETVMKSWLSRGKSNGLLLGGLAKRLDLMANDRNMTPSQRDTLKGLFKHLGGIVRSAKSAPTKQSPPAENNSAAEQIAKLHSTVDTLAGRIAAMMP